MEGSVQIETVDLFGARSILGICEQEDVFAESYACIPDQPLLVDVVAKEDTTVLFIHVPSLLSVQAPQGGSPVVQNLLGIASRKNLQLSMRILHSAPKKTGQALLLLFRAGNHPGIYRNSYPSGLAAIGRLSRSGTHGVIQRAWEK